jgi:hypothetical protein
VTAVDRAGTRFAHSVTREGADLGALDERALWDRSDLVRILSVRSAEAIRWEPMRWALAAGIATGCSFTPRAAPDPTGVDGNPTDTVQPDANVAVDAIGVDAIDGPPAVPLHVRIEAKIDGRSNLVLHGTDAYWMHFQFAAPGRETFTNLPTTFDTVEWFPDWPDVPDAENRDCNCMSSTFTDLPAAVPRVPSTVTITHLLGRRTTTPSAIQMPDATNDFTLILEFTDVGLSGSDIYAAQLDVVPL